MKRTFAFLLAAGCGGSSAPPPVSIPAEVAIPDAIKMPPDHAVSIEARAVGFQVYTCKAKADDANAFEWSLKAPDAELFDGAGKKIGKHYAGPTWESDDGSKVVGQVKAKVDSPDGSIPWLLLEAKSTEGTGVFAKTTHVHRISTEGGKAPADGCTTADAGKESRVPYKATYRFYAAK